MPSTSWSLAAGVSDGKKLTRRERDKEKELSGRIQAAGILLVVGADKNHEPEIMIRQDFEAYENSVFDVIEGGAVQPGGEDTGTQLASRTSRILRARSCRVKGFCSRDRPC